MNATTAPSPSPRWFAPVFLGGLLSGAIDLTYACTYHGLVNKIPPVRIFQSIGSGWFGKASFEMGWQSATIGFLSHFGILIVAAGIFYAARRRFALLRERPYPCGMAFGVGIWLTMNYIVLPLSAAPHFQSKPLTTATDFAVHVLLLGPAISLVAKRFDR
ncbi:MAG TPA: hypothetical protein VKB52_05755 [Rhodanobacteraceae bacterium]|nr:hypothetical protein [Rhodanobacteraceae bacterium]